MACLAGLPNELFERIVEFLDLKSICNTRLVSRSISDKTNQKAFQLHFRTARVNLTVSHLESFEQATAGALGENIEEVHFIGIVHSSHEIDELIKPTDWEAKPLAGIALLQAEWAVRTLHERRAEWALSMEEGVPLTLLRRAFSNIGRRSRRRVQTLHIELQVLTDPRKPLVMVHEMWRPRWALAEVYRVASETFTLVMQNVLEGRLSKVDVMNVYATNPHDTRDPQILYCSLPSDVLTELLADIPSAGQSSLAHIRSLAISTVPPRAALHAENPDDFEDKVRQGDLLWGHTKLLQACNNIETLHLGISEYPYVMYRSKIRSHCERTLFNRQIMHIAENVNLPCLRVLHLRGLTATDSHIAALFTAVCHTLQQAALISVNVQGAVAVAVLPLMDGTCSKLETFNLENIHENGTNVDHDPFGDRTEPEEAEEEGEGGWL